MSIGTARMGLADNAPAPATAGAMQGGERWTIITIVCALMGLGIVVVFSASFDPTGSGSGYFFARQIVFVPLAIGVMCLMMCVNVDFLNKRWFAIGLLCIVVLILAAVLVVNSGPMGTRRWFHIRVGGMDMGVQPSEVAKVGMVLFLAWLLARRGAEPASFTRSFIPAAAVIALVCGLIALADFGTAALVGIVAVALCVMSGVRLRHLALLVPPSALAAYLLVWQVPYRKERILSFLDPWADAQGSGYHAAQSLIAIGSGGFFGRGLGNGMQKLGYLPEESTDFIYATICEEMGVVGGLLVILLFAAFVWRCGRASCLADNRFKFILAAGITLMIGLQAAMNMAVVMVAIPTKGIALPFISYGGSSLVMTAASVGLLLAVARRPTASEL